VKEATDKITGQNHKILVNLDVALYIDDLLRSWGNPMWHTEVNREMKYAECMV